MARPNGSIRDLVSFLKSVLVISLHNWDELDVIHPELIPEEAVHIQWMVSILSVDRAKDVELHLVFLEQPGGPYNPVEGSMASLVFPEGIMKFSGAVQAKADQKFIRVE